MKGYIYRFHNESGKVLYVGKSINLSSRLGNHSHLRQEYYDEVAWVEAIAFDNQEMMNYAERYWIVKHKPPFNTEFIYEKHKEDDKELDTIYREDFEFCVSTSSSQLNQNNQGGIEMNGLLITGMILGVVGLYGHYLEQEVFIAVFFFLFGILTRHNFVINIQPVSSLVKRDYTQPKSKQRVKLAVNREDVIEPTIIQTKQDKKENVLDVREDTAESHELSEENKIKETGLVLQEAPLIEEEIVFEDGIVFEDEIARETLMELMECSYGVSASLIQRRKRVGYNRASRILEEYEALGILEESESSTKPRPFNYERLEELGLLKTPNEKDEPQTELRQEDAVEVLQDERIIDLSLLIPKNS